MLTGKKKILQNGQLIFESNSFQETFSFPFNISQNILVVSKHGDRFELSINNQDFSNLYRAKTPKRNSIDLTKRNSLKATLKNLDITKKSPEIVQKQYTLVLDLDETLVHYKNKEHPYLTDDKRLKIRPGVQNFLESLHPYYRFVIFTAAQKKYANFVLTIIDPNGVYFE